MNINSGTFAAFANVDCGTDIGCTPQLIFTLTEVLAVVPNSTYSVGFYLSDDSPSGMGIDVENNDTQIFINSTGVLSPSFVNIANGDTSFHLFSGSFSTGASNSATVTFQINGSGTSRAGVSLDDFFVTPASAVPEPTSYALISFGVAMLALLKIRRAAQCDKQ